LKRSAWRAFAPWSNDVQVEQDYLLCKAVATIFEDEFLSSEVAMRGGTVLHEGHLAPAGRYSGATTLSVRSYDFDEMLGTKMRALLQREHGRDLFDLWQAWEYCKSNTTVAVSPERVGAAFRFYMEREGSQFSGIQYEKELSRRMQSQKFLRDLDGYLPIGTVYDPELAYRGFCEIFLPHVDAGC
jgi:predicted nucleotidyltransferase component of viral defense system